MFTHDWRFEISFSADMTSLEVPDRYKGKFARRLASAVDDKKLEDLLTTRSWSRNLKSVSEPLGFAKHGKVLDTERMWKSWEIFDGLLIIKGKRDGKEVRDEFLLKEAKEPYRLQSPESGDGRPRLEER